VVDTGRGQPGGGDAGGQQRHRQHGGRDHAAAPDRPTPLPGLVHPHRTPLLVWILAAHRPVSSRTVTLEQDVIAAIELGRDRLVELAGTLISFDTTAREGDQPARDEAALQQHLAGLLAGAGADAEVWEPAPGEVSGSRQIPGPLDFAGRPQMAARFAGTGGGPNLLFNGHIDVVPGEPRERWTSDPNTPQVRDGNLYGRGACDMKGGVAAMVFAAQVLAESGVRLKGDLIVNTVTDEESTGAGGLAAVSHGISADAGIVTEPTAFEVWVGCRGSLSPTITVEGRPGHAEMAQPHWRQGGAVNAIEKMTVVLDAIRRLREEWRGRPDQSHQHLSAGDIVPARITGGEWVVTYPSSCTLESELMYLPASADGEGWGTGVQREVTEWIQRHCAADAWLAEHPPTIAWGPDIPPYEVDPAHPIVATMLDASAAVGEPSRLSGLDSWFDAASFSRFGGTPCIGWGPRSIAWAHTIDEYVPVDDLVRCAQGLAAAAIRYCGTDG
jgi:acetylornithine deacetylase